MENVLIGTVEAELFPYQINKITREVNDYLQLNEEAKSYVIERCPKCGAIHPRVTKAGNANNGAGKPMLKCHSCGHRFVVDNGQLTYYSHQGKDKWDQLIVDTMNGESIAKTAAKLDISQWTVFRMRHKLLYFMEQTEGEVVTEDVIEMDEKYLQQSHKGSKIPGIKPRKRGEKATKPGLSDQQLCISTAVQRQGECYAQVFNMGNPSEEELMGLQDHVMENSLVYTDGKTAYGKLLGTKHCTWKMLSEKSQYNSVDNLSCVNSFHSRIESLYEHYRGVATKYINRYCALFSIRRKYQDCDDQEKLLSYLRELKHRCLHFYIRQIKTDDLFRFEWAA